MKQKLRRLLEAIKSLVKAFFQEEASAELLCHTTQLNSSFPASSKIVNQILNQQSLMFLFLLLYTNTFSYFYPDCVSNQLASPRFVRQSVIIVWIADAKYIIQMVRKGG